MSYQTSLTSLSRTPVRLAVITLDYCELTYGAAPCGASGGTPCYNTFLTCRAKSTYSRTTRDYRFTSADAPLPFKTGERPYLSAASYLPTEVKESLATTGRVKLTFADEPDADAGIDPYVESRSAFPDIPGTFWKKLVSRNPNYKGRYVRIYEGFVGMSEAELLENQKFVGTIYDINIKGASVTVEAEDLLKSLDNIEIPPKINCKLVTDIDAAQTAITLSDVSELDAVGYVLIKEEVIQYTEKNEITNQITDCTRGARNTEATEHSANDKVGKCRYYRGNPFDILVEMLEIDAGLDTAYIDTAAFSFWRSWPTTDVTFEALVIKPKKLKDLFFEIVRLLDARAWIAEDLQVTVRRNLPNQPGRSYRPLTDAENIIHNSASSDLNDKSRITRTSIYWDKSTLGKMDEPKDFRRLDIGIDADAESASGYDEKIEKKIFCRWINGSSGTEEQLGTYMRNLALRLTRTYRDAQPKVACDVELKDLDVRTGEWVTMTTDEILDIDGTPSQGHFQVVKRKRKGSTIHLSLQRTVRRRLGYIAPNTATMYTVASEAQQEYGFVCDGESMMSNGDAGYFVY